MTVSSAASATKAAQDASGNVISTTYEKVANKGQANGYASLDANSKVPSSQLPDAALLSLGSTSTTAYAGDKGAANATAISSLQTAVSTLESATTGLKSAAYTESSAYLASTHYASSVPSNAVFTDTHYTTGLIVASTTTATTQSSAINTNGKVRLNLKDDTNVRASLLLSGSGGTTVKSSGSTITIATDLSTYATTDAMNTAISSAISGVTSGTVASATYAASAATASNADSATYATSAGTASNADSATYATSAGTADSATKASQDGAGNVISSTYATKEEMNGIVAAADALVFKGTIGTDGTVTALPNTHSTGWTYKVITAGTYAGQVCEVGDMIICVADGTAANNAHWSVI